MYKRSLSLLAAVLLVTGCSTKTTTPYQSKATLDASMSMVNSQFTVVTANNENLEYPSGFGVIAGVDNEKTYYTLISPTLNNASADNVLSTYDLIHASVLNASELQEILDVISIAVTRWNAVYDETKGQILWKSVVADRGDTYFSFYNSAKGVKASIGLNTHEKKVEIYSADDYVEMDVREKYVLVNSDEDVLSVTTLKYDFPIESLEELKGVQALLQKALEMSQKPKIDEEVTTEESNVTASPLSQENNVTVPVEAVVVEESNTTAVSPVVVEETNTTVAEPVIANETVEAPAKETVESTENNTTKTN